MTVDHQIVTQIKSNKVFLSQLRPPLVFSTPFSSHCLPKIPVAAPTASVSASVSAPIAAPSTAAARASVSRHAMSDQQRDTLDKAVAFLQKREGIDKTLKIIRYTSRLVAAVSPKGSDTRRRFEALQSSVGTSRKAYRLGKFLQDVNALRRLPLSKPGALRSGLLLLEAAAYLGEGAYYFLDQFTWLMKAGFLSKRHEAAVSKASAWAEALGYAASISLSMHKLQQLAQQEDALLRRVQAACDEAGACLEPGLLKQLRLLRAARALRLALICQDLADALMAVNDITEGRLQGFNHPVVLSCAGLISAAVSTYKYWP